MFHAKRHRVLLAQVASRGVDHRQPVGVRVLAEADIGAGGGDLGANAGQVLGRWFRRVREAAVRLFT